MDQSEGRILYHVTYFTAQVVFGGLGPSLGKMGTSPARPNMKTRLPEMTSSKKPEINDRPRDLTKTFYSRSSNNSTLVMSTSSSWA